jgi:membrane protein DedA with SNARE-associated domain
MPSSRRDDTGGVPLGSPRTPAVVAAFELAVRIHHHFHGSSVGYIALAAAAAASWVGIPGPGEPVLIAAAVLASRGKLDLAETLLIAWLGAMVGGIGGWALGRHGGRKVMAARGPFRAARVRIMERGEAFYARFGVVAVYLAPTWVAGVSEMRLGRFLVAQTVAAVVWVLLVGGGAYLVGPSIIDVAGDLGLFGALAFGALIVVVLIVERRRRRRRAAARFG